MRQLIDESVALLRSRMAELGIEAETPGDLLSKAKEIVLRHKELETKSCSLQQQVFDLEQQEAQLKAQRRQEQQDAVIRAKIPTLFSGVLLQMP